LAELQLLQAEQIKDAFSNFRLLHSATSYLRVYSPILSGDGSMVSEKHDKLCRWKEYYSDLLHEPPASFSF